MLPFDLKFRFMYRSNIGLAVTHNIIVGCSKVENASEMLSSVLCPSKPLPRCSVSQAFISISGKIASSGCMVCSVLESAYYHVIHCVCKYV